MNSNWVGAAHLKIGDQIKQADGTVGVVANVTTVQQTQEMFNLTVDEAHTFYIGQNGWLVHNGGKTNTPIPYGYETDRQAYLNQVAKKYGINLKGIQLVYDPEITQEGMTYEKEGGRVIRVGRSSFNSGSTLLEMEANVANSIAPRDSTCKEFSERLWKTWASGAN